MCAVQWHGRVGYASGLGTAFLQWRDRVGYASGLGTAFLQRHGHVGYTSSHLNSGWGVIIALHVLRAELAVLLASTAALSLL